MECDFSERHPGTRNVLRWFDHEYLPPHLQAIVRPIQGVAF